MIFEKQLSRKMKYQALYWLRIDQRCAFVVTECPGLSSADAMGANEKKMIEVEVKISREDLRNDFKKAKHRYYLNHEGYYTGYNDEIPTHFYFAVTPDLVDEAQALLEKHKAENYGIISADQDAELGAKWVVVRRAKWLHKRPPSTKQKFRMALRMGSELIRFHEAHL